jgi:hypothetical protein
MIKLVSDSREQSPLRFSAVDGVEYAVECIPTGDYSARIGDEWVGVTIERKEIGDLFSNYTSNYEKERAKILRAKELGWKFILAIEASATEVRKGHAYWKNGELHESKKSGLAMIRQLMSVMVKYEVSVWFCLGRIEMAWMIQEHFLAIERYRKKNCQQGVEGCDTSGGI